MCYVVAWTKRGEFNLVKRDQAASCELGEKKLDFQHVKARVDEGEIVINIHLKHFARVKWRVKELAKDDLVESNL